METEDIWKRIRDEIRSNQQVSLIEGRDCVWDDLAHMYASTKNELRICGVGADLSDECTQSDIHRLGQETERIAADKKKIVTRIQLVDTWSSWLDFQLRVWEEHRGTYALYFTDQQKLRFVPQLNIKDNDEVSLVSSEEQRELTYSIRIRRLDSGGSQAIQLHLDEFERLRKRSIRLEDRRHLRRFAEALKKVKRWQMSCLLSYEFHSQRESGAELFSRPDYTSVQEYFAFDRDEFEKFAWDTLNQQYAAYRERDYPTLCSVLSILTGHTRSNVDQLSTQILSDVHLGDHTSKSREIGAFLNEQDIESASDQLIGCLSRSLFLILRKICGGPI